MKNTQRKQPVSVSVAQTPILTEYPSWFINQPKALVGIGLAPYSSFNPQSSFDKAFAYALEDLNSNFMSVVTVEQFRQGGVEQFQEEIGITEDYSASNVIKVDSVIAGDLVFMLISVEPIQVETQLERINSTAPLEIPASAIVQQANSTLVHGESVQIQSNPYKAWALSKQSAFKRLGLFTAIKVQAVQKIYNENYENVSYMKSRVALKQVRVKSRWLDSGELQTLIEVDNEHIVNLTQ